MSPRPDVSEERRSQIMASAMNVFARRGFASTRMEDVAKESGLSKGLLYWYFKSKEEIILAIADLLFGKELDKMQSLHCEGISSRACLIRYLEMFIADLSTTLHVTPVVMEFYSLAFRSPAVRQVMKRYLRTFVDVIEPVVQRGMDNGEFVSGDAHQMALAIGAMLEGSLLLWVYDPESIQVEQQLRAGAGLVLDGLAKGAPS